MDNAVSMNVKAGISLKESETPPSRASSSSRAKASPVAPKRATRRTTAESAKAKADELFMCPICCDDSNQETLALSCEHRFCTDCWNQYIVSKIREEGDCSIRCMASGCTLIAPDAFIGKALEEHPDTIRRYQELIVKHYVAANSTLKFCPYPSCTYTVSCPSASSKSALSTIVPTVNCGMSANHKFCFGCPIDGDHRPLICTVAKLWLKKCEDDSETANWIKSNTKECGKCQSTIEKNGGCK